MQLKWMNGNWRVCVYASAVRCTVWSMSANRYNLDFKKFCTRFRWGSNRFDGFILVLPTHIDLLASDKQISYFTISLHTVDSSYTVYVVHMNSRTHITISIYCYNILNQTITFIPWIHGPKRKYSDTKHCTKQQIE